VVRELQEELGVGVQVVADWGAHDFTTDQTPMRYALFEAKVITGQPSLMEPIFDSLRYFSWSEMRQMQQQLSPNARNLVQLFWRGRLKARPLTGGSADQPDLVASASAEFGLPIR